MRMTNPHRLIDRSNADYIGVEDGFFETIQLIFEFGISQDMRLLFDGQTKLAPWRSVNISVSSLFLPRPHLTRYSDPRAI